MCMHVRTDTIIDKLVFNGVIGGQSSYQTI